MIAPFLSLMAALMIMIAGNAAESSASATLGLLTERHGGMQLADRNARPVVQPLPTWDITDPAKAPPGSFGFGFSQRWSGSLDIAAAGEHAFRIRADDGIRLLVDGRLLADTWELKGGQTVECAPIRLARGRAAFCLEYFQRLDRQTLDLQWKRPGAADFEPIPAVVQHPTRPVWPQAATSVRIFPAKGRASGMLGGRFTGSTKAPTAEVRAHPMPR